MLLLSNAATMPCQEFGAAVVDFHELFDEAVLAPPDYWAKDGLHPMPAAEAVE